MSQIVAKTLTKIKYYQQVVDMYADSRRVYHGRNHLDHQLYLIDRCVSALPDDQQTFAAYFLLDCSLFHDCFYTYKMPHGFCERVSSQYAEQILGEHKKQQKYISAIKKAILATAYYDDKQKQVETVSNSEAFHPLSLLFLDIDLHTLQDSTGLYDAQIKQEALNFGITEESYLSGVDIFQQNMKKRVEGNFFHLPYTNLSYLFDNNLVKAKFESC